MRESGFDYFKAFLRIQAKPLLLYKALTVAGVQGHRAGEGTPTVSLSDFLLSKDPFHFKPIYTYFFNHPPFFYPMLVIAFRYNFPQTSNLN